MAASCHPNRSVSFPSRSQLNSAKIQVTLKKLKSQDLSASTSSSLTAETIQLGLLNLVELYVHAQQLILSPSTQQGFLGQHQGKLVEQALERSVALIDTCSYIRDLILRFKEQVRDLQSALRRKGHLSIDSEIAAYMAFRKKLAKDAARSLKVIKQAEDKFAAADPMLTLDPSLNMLVTLLKEVYAVTIAVFKSVFLYLSAPTKASGWSLISRLVTKKSGALSNNTEERVNEAAGVDLALHNRNDTKEDVLLVRGRVQALDASIQILEGELDCLSRCLVQNRVSLLNILTA